MSKKKGVQWKEELEERNEGVAPALVKQLDAASQSRITKMVASVQQQIQKLKDDDEQYLSVRKVLEELPNKVQHQIMVPVGDLAFFPGYMQHTNEIMVLLGDNYFALRSAKQAIEILERRRNVIAEHKKKQEEELRGLYNTMGLTSGLLKEYKEEGIVEIREEYDEAQEELAIEKQLSALPQKIQKRPPITDTDEELERYLDELERLELQEEELERQNAQQAAAGASAISKAAAAAPATAPAPRKVTPIASAAATTAKQEPVRRPAGGGFTGFIVERSGEEKVETRPVVPAKPAASASAVVKPRPQQQQQQQQEEEPKPILKKRVSRFKQEMSNR